MIVCLFVHHNMFNFVLGYLDAMMQCDIISAALVSDRYLMIYISPISYVFTEKLHNTPYNNQRDKT